jgi:predicted RNA-binding Zn-ribbon protein involved in translation (DUF1610 family)
MLGKRLFEALQCDNKEQIERMIRNGTATIDHDRDTEIFDLEKKAFRKVVADAIEVTPTKRQWHNCPTCGQKLCRKELDSKAKKVYLWCKHCKKEIEVNF